MSLKSLLHSEIQRRGYLSLSEVHAIAAREGHKSSNAERRLRKSESPDVDAVVNEKGHIIGYKWVGKELSTEVYSQDFLKLKEKQKQQSLI